MGEVALFGRGTGLMTREDMARGLNNAAMEAPRVGGEFQFLKLDKGNGQWIYGQEETPVEDGSLWAINPMSFEYGYIAWDKNQQVEGEVMVPISRPLPTRAELRVKDSPDGQPTGEHGWQYQQSMVMVCVTGEDAGGNGVDPIACQYKQSSVGSQKAFKAIIDAVTAKVVAGADDIVPIVEMKSDSYKHKKWGRIFNPIFEIKEWRTLGDASPVESSTSYNPKPGEDPEFDRVTTDLSKAKAARAEGEKRLRKAVLEPEVPAEGSEAEEAALAAEYAREQEAAGAAAATPRRRVRR